MINGTMREIYDIIIEKLERDKLRFSTDISNSVENMDYSKVAELCYRQAKAKRDYCSELIEFFKEARDNL